MKDNPRGELSGSPHCPVNGTRTIVIDLLTIAVVVTIFGCIVFSALGCRTTKAVPDLIQYKAVSGGPGYIVLESRDGKVEKKAVPMDYTWDFRVGAFSYSTSGFRLEPLLGASCWQSEIGIEGSPWAGVRFLHVMNVGFDAGFDKDNFSVGIDWLHRGIAIGPSLFFPFDLSKNRAGMKAAVWF